MLDRTPVVSPRLLPVLAVLAGVAFMARPAPAQQVESYDLAGSVAAIWNLAGSVLVTSSGGSSVTVRLSRGGDDGDRLEVATGALTLNRREIGEVDALRVIYPSDEIAYRGSGSSELRVRDDGTFHREGRERGRKVRIHDSASGLDAHADLEIGVPRGGTVLVYLAVGDVRVEDVDGDLTVDVGSADVQATGTGGRLLLDTGSGDIELGGATGLVTLDTGSGDVRVTDVNDGELVVDTGSGNVSGGGIEARSLRVDTGSGDVILDRVAARQVLVDTGSGHVDIGFVDDPGEVSVDTGSGHVHLTFPPAWASVVELDTSSGEIHSDFRMRVEDMDEDHVRGQVGEGGGTLQVDTGSGDIRLIRG